MGTWSDFRQEGKGLTSEPAEVLKQQRGNLALAEVTTWMIGAPRNAPNAYAMGDIITMVLFHAARLLGTMKVSYSIHMHGKLCHVLHFEITKTRKNARES